MSNRENCLYITNAYMIFIVASLMKISYNIQLIFNSKYIECGKSQYKHQRASITTFARVENVEVP